MGLDFWETIENQLENSGFFKVRQKENWYWRAENPVLYLLCLWDAQGEHWCAETEAFTAFGRDMEKKAEQFHCTRVVALSVLVDKKEVDNFVDNVDNLWITQYENKFFRVWWNFSTESGKVTAAEGQPDRLIGVEKLLRAAAAGEMAEALPLREAGEGEKPLVSLTIFAICMTVLAFMLTTGQRSEWLSAYGLSREGMLAGEWYRLFTCMFLHSGLIHLASNGIYLYYFGFRSEQLLGSVRFLVLYLVSGVCGGLFSLLFGSGFGVSIGASGAIYGLLGAMLLLTRKRGAAYTGMNYATMLLLAITAIGFGFLEEGVDNYAHIGGFLGGILCFALFMRKK